MVGMRDVARKAGVSLTTVSRVLSHDDTLSVTEETRQKIYEAIEETGYSKKNNQRKVASIAVVTPVDAIDEIGDPYFSAIKYGIDAEAKVQKIAANRFIRIGDNKDLPSLDKVGAVIVLGLVSPEILANIYEDNRNVIVIDDPYALSCYDSVFTDFEQITVSHLERLYALGHHAIGFIGGNRTLAQADGSQIKEGIDARLQSYQRWMTEKGLYRKEYTFVEEWSSESGAGLAEKMLSTLQDNNRPTALIIASDQLAVGVYRTLQKKGIRIPEDISIVSYDNLDYSQYLVPSLSTAAIETELLGRVAVRMAKDRIFNDRVVPLKVIVPSKIIVRESEIRLDN